jgi:acyl transferase domain-containing protein
MFNMSPREALQTDPTHRLLMMATYEALEMAGYNPNSKLSQKFGTFIGMATDDWREYNIRQDIDIYYVTGGLRAFAAGRLNYHFKWDGPSYVIDTVCSSSAASIELACAALLKGSIDVAVAGGGNIMTGPNLFTGLSRGGFLSPTGSCKTLDEGADGYCRGDGVGVVILKRLEDAIASNDNIQGVIRGIATNHSSRAISITQPHAPTQQILCQQVLHEAGLEPDDINYVEMHGTGTQAGDTTEITSIVSTFGRGGRRDNPLYIGSVKSNIGHSEAVCFWAPIIILLFVNIYRRLAWPRSSNR